MRLYPGLSNNLTVMEHACLCEQLFRSTGTFHLPDQIVPLHINSAKDSILAMMPECNAQGVEPLWPMPTLENEMDWASNLTEKASRIERDLIKATKDEELAYITNKAAEVARISRAGSS